MKNRLTRKKRMKPIRDSGEEIDLKSMVGLLYGQFTLQQISEYYDDKAYRATKKAFEKHRRVE